MPTVHDFTPDSGTGPTVQITKSDVALNSALVVFAFVGGGQTATIALDTGETLTPRGNFSDGTYYRLYKLTAEGLTAGSKTITLTQSGGGPRWFLHAYELRNVPVTGVFDAEDAFTDNGTTQHAAGLSGITIASGATALAMFFQDRVNTNTHGGWTSISAAAGSGWYPYAAKRDFAGGASGERATLTNGSGGYYIAGLISIKAGVTGSSVTPGAGVATVSSAGNSTAATVPTAAAGAATVSAVGGTLVALVSSVFKNNTGTALVNLTNVTAWVYSLTSGALVVKKTAQATNGSGVLTLQDAAIATGTTYRVVFRNEVDGAEGMETLTAS